LYPLVDEGVGEFGSISLVGETIVYDYGVEIAPLWHQ